MGIFERYPGSKAGSGMYQRLINLIPPHRIYVEPFLGGGAVMRYKAAAKINLGYDLDPRVVAEWQAEAPAAIPNLEVSQRNALEVLDSPFYWYPDTFIYCDPPYLLSTRMTQERIYDFEMSGEVHHQKLLKLLNKIDCMVMISGYWSELYERMLEGWRTYSFQAMTRSGKMATEWVWMNYPEPTELHDYRYLGDDYRQRERIRRKKTRWVKRLNKLDALERMALLSAIEETR